MQKNKRYVTSQAKMGILIVCSILVILLAIGIGSVFITPLEIVKIISAKLIGGSCEIAPITVGIIWKMRLPRVLLAFLVGALLSVSGTVMQSVLKNPLASSYTLGVSSGAALCVAITIFWGLSFSGLGLFALPVMGLLGGMTTVVFAVMMSDKLDRNMNNQTIILVGMVTSLFTNGLLTLLSALSGETMQRMIYWQMGSFALKDWTFVAALLPVCIIGILILVFHARELDQLTFGEEAAFAVGISVKKTKWILLMVSAALTGCAVALAGVIGFVDLIAPHIARKLFGSAHKKILPMAALLGGSFMVIADVIARTVVTPSELPIGAVTAIIGAPFFISVFFRKREVF